MIYRDADWSDGACLHRIDRRTRSGLGVFCGACGRELYSGDAAGMVREFHEAFGQPVLEKPTVPAKARCVLRGALTLEEQLELLVGLGDDHDEPIKRTVASVVKRLLTSEQDVDIVKVADALGDLLYVVHGTAHEFGIDLRPVVAEIHRANMAKLGPDGKPIYDENGKVTKPPGWTPPDIEGVLRAQGWEP